MDADARRLEISYERATGQKVKCIPLDDWKSIVAPLAKQLVENYQDWSTAQLRNRGWYGAGNMISRLELLIRLGWEPSTSYEAFVVQECRKIVYCTGSSWRGDCVGEIRRWRCEAHRAP